MSAERLERIVPVGRVGNLDRKLDVTMLVASHEEFDPFIGGRRQRPELEEIHCHLYAAGSRGTTEAAATASKFDGMTDRLSETRTNASEKVARFCEAESETRDETTEGGGDG